MTRPATQLTRSIRIIALTIAPGTFSFGAPAMAETRAGVDLSASGKIASNPHEQVVTKTGVAGSVKIDPWIRIVGEQSGVELRGNFTVDRYAQDYGTDTTASVRLNAERRLSPYVGISGGASYQTSRAGIHDLLLSRDTAADVVPPPTTPLPDVTFGGIRIRAETIDAHLGLDIKPSPHDQLHLNFGASRSRFDSINASNYDSYSAGLGYARTLSERTSATASIQISKSDYLNTRAGDGTIITHLVGIQRQFSQTLTLSASVGASFSRTHRADGSLQNFTSLSGQLRLCNAGIRSTLCLSAARTAQPTAIGGIAAVSSVAFALDNQLGQRDRLSLTAQYSKNDRSTGVLGGGSQFYGASASVTHEFNRRFTAFITPSFSKTIDQVTPRKANYQMEVGLRFRFGARS